MRFARVALLSVSACSFTHGMLPGDAGPDDGGGDVLDSSFGAWSPPIELTKLTSDDEDDPSLTNDLLEIYFGSRRTTGGLGGEDIWFAKRNAPSDDWGQPMPAVGLNTSFAETTGKITGDGLSIFFTSNRDGSYDIYFSQRLNRDAAWSDPMRVVELSTGDGDYAAFAQSNLLRVIECIGPSPAGEALYISERASTSALWALPTVVDELDEAGVSECDPIEPHPRALYYASNRLTAKYDIYRAQHNTVADPYGFRTPVDAVNIPEFNDRDPWVSPDERTMVFSSDRTGGTNRLYQTTR